MLSRVVVRFVLKVWRRSEGNLSARFAPLPPLSLTVTPCLKVRGSSLPGSYRRVFVFFVAVLLCTHTSPILLFSGWNVIRSGARRCGHVAPVLSQRACRGFEGEGCGDRQHDHLTGTWHRLCVRFATGEAAGRLSHGGQVLNLVACLSVGGSLIRRGEGKLGGRPHDLFALTVCTSLTSTRRCVCVCKVVRF